MGQLTVDVQRVGPVLVRGPSQDVFVAVSVREGEVLGAGLDERRAEFRGHRHPIVGLQPREEVRAVRVADPAQDLGGARGNQSLCGGRGHIIRSHHQTPQKYQHHSCLHHFHIAKGGKKRSTERKVFCSVREETMKLHRRGCQDGWSLAESTPPTQLDRSDTVVLTGGTCAGATLKAEHHTPSDRRPRLMQ